MAKNDSQNAAAEKKAPGPFVVLRPVDPSTVTRSAPEGAPEGAESNGASLFEIVGEYVGKTSKQAIGQAVAAHGGGEYIAVPKRSFTPRKVESVGVPRLRWS